MLAIAVTPEILVVGALTGLTYGALAIGLVLIYRSSRIVNFAYGEMGAFGAALLGKVVLDLHWNFFVALAVVTAVGGLIGAAVDLLVVRRLANASRLALLVATIGVAQVLFFAQAVLPGINHVAQYPTPFNVTVRIGNLFLHSEHLMVIAFVPAIVVGLSLFLNRSSYGIAIRAAAANPDGAELAGISTRRVSTVVWVIAGALSTLTAVLINPLRGTIVGVPSVALGPGLLLRALAAALVGRMRSLPLVMAGGVAIGMVEAVVFANVHNPGVADGLVFVLVLVLVLTRATASAAEGSYSMTARMRAAVAGLGWERRISRSTAVAAVAVAVALPLVFSTAANGFLLGRIVVYAMVALSVWVITGWAGQLSLCQFAFVGLGAMTTATLVNRGMPFVPAVVYSTVAGVVLALIVGAPALRIRGLYLAVATLAFAVAARGWFFGLDVFTNGKTTVSVPRAHVGPFDLHSQRAYYYFCLAVLVVLVAVVARLRRSGVGRVLVAVRDNENAASSFTVSPVVAKLVAFGIAGGIAALAGALLGGLRVQFGPDAFGVEESLQAVAMVVIGGVGSVAGPLLGALYVVGAPALFGDTTAVRMLTSGAGLLVLLLYMPGGLVQLVDHVRHRLATALDRRAGSPAAPPPEPALPGPPAPAPNARPVGDAPALRVSDVAVHFGGVQAVAGASLHVSAAETVGLIGSNGAGKSTLLNVIGGFLPASGRVELLGTDVSALPPHRRARLGLGRIFQDARLFPDLTVVETIEVALEGRERTELVPSMLAMAPARRAERWKAGEAAEIVDFLGLGAYAQSFIGDLSTGSRRIVELGCQLAVQASVLLLDEPTAGVAQREAEAFGPLIKRVQAELGASLLVVEHDIPLITSISDRLYCMSAGQVIAEGRPDDVRRDPKVIAAYLGTDERAIERSGAGVVSAKGRAVRRSAPKAARA